MDLFYVYYLDELNRFPVHKWFFYPAVLKFGGWSALALEFSLGLLVWIKELRYPLLVTGLLFHLWLECSLNILTFQWDILAAYVLFIDSEVPVEVAGLVLIRGSHTRFECLSFNSWL